MPGVQLRIALLLLALGLAGLLVAPTTSAHCILSNPHKIVIDCDDVEECVDDGAEIAAGLVDHTTDCLP